MNHVIIVAGGVGTRLHSGIPKQYLPVLGKPIIMYSIAKFAKCDKIDSIIIVLADEWRDFVKELIRKEGLTCKYLFAKSGKSRQHSVMNGLRVLKDYANENDLVFIHDSVRPLFDISIVYDSIKACNDYDAALPVIPVKDATYLSSDKNTISSLLPRESLFSGQSPECFVFGRFFRAHDRFEDVEIEMIRGCAELALKAGLTVKLIKGSEDNFKITTREDLRAFELASNSKEQ